MLRADVALIGGTGTGEILRTWGGRAVCVPTPAGPLRGRLAERDGLTAFLLHRHSSGHRVPPHLVGYKAMALGLAAVGAKCCLSTAAVGSLRTDWAPGTMAVCTDMIDVTGRRQTLFDHSVKHTPMDPAFLAARWLTQAAGDLAKPNACYVCADGPRYETPAEVKAMVAAGGDVVGMTAGTEAVLFREAGVPYGCLAVVTNIGVGLSPEGVEHGQVTDVMTKAGPAALDIIWSAACAAAQAT